MTLADQPAETAQIVRSQLLDREHWLTYGFTRRVPGMGTAEGNVSYSGGRDREMAWAMRQRWLAPTGLDADDIVTTGQVHGNALLPVRASDRGRGAHPSSEILGLADATMTQEAGPILFSLHADCLPMLLADPVRRVVAVVHAGWRGTVADIAGQAVDAMASTYGSQTSDLVAFLGPGISGAAYEVGPEVVDAWRSLHGSASAAAWPGQADRWQFDPATANAERLLTAGLRPERIERSDICTFSAQNDWFSHRAQGPATGRFGAFIAIL